MIYDADIATRARNYDPASLDTGEDSSDGSLQGSVSAEEALEGNKLFHRDPIIDGERSSSEQITDARSRQLKLSSAISTKSTDSRANDKNHRPKNLGSDTHKPETDQKRKSDMNTAQECTEAGVRLKKPDERGRTRMNEDKNRLTSDPITASDGKVMNYEQFKEQRLHDESLAEIWQKARVGHPRFLSPIKEFYFQRLRTPAGKVTP